MLVLVLVLVLVFDVARPEAGLASGLAPVDECARAQLGPAASLDAGYGLGARLGTRVKCAWAQSRR